MLAANLFFFFLIKHLIFVSERERRLVCVHSAALRKEAVIMARQVVDFPNCFSHGFWVIRVAAGFRQNCKCFFRITYTTLMGRTQAVPDITFRFCVCDLFVSCACHSYVNAHNLHNFKGMSVFPTVFLDTCFRNHSFTFPKTGNF